MNATDRAWPRAASDLAAFVALAIVFRLALWWMMGRAIDSADAILYLEGAQHLARGEFGAFDARLPVLFPLLTAVFSFMAPDIETAARCVSLIASSLTVVPIYLLSRALHGAHAARIAALIVALWTWPADYGSRETPDAMACLFWFGGAYGLARAMRDGGAWVVMAPMLLFLLHLTRPEGTFFAIGAIAVAGVFLARGQSGAKRFGASLAGLLVLIAIQAAMNRVITGSSTVNARMVSVERAANFIVGERSEDVARALIALTTEALPIMIGPYVLLFAGVSLFNLHSRRHRDGRLELFLIAVAAIQVLLASASTYAEPRYVMAPVIVATLSGAHGMAVTSEALCASGRPRWIAALPVSGMLMFLFGYAALMVAPEMMGRMPREPRELREAGAWMKQNLDPGLVIARKPQIGFYAGMPTTGPSADETMESLVQRARDAGATYVVVDERYTPKLSPGLAGLFHGAPAPEGLTLLHEVRPEYDGGRVLIFSVTAN